MVGCPSMGIGGSGDSSETISSREIDREHTVEEGMALAAMFNGIFN